MVMRVCFQLVYHDKTVWAFMTRLRATACYVGLMVDSKSASPVLIRDCSLLQIDITEETQRRAVTSRALLAPSASENMYRLPSAPGRIELDIGSSLFWPFSYHTPELDSRGEPKSKLQLTVPASASREISLPSSDVTKSWPASRLHDITGMSDLGKGCRALRGKVRYYFEPKRLCASTPLFQRMYGRTSHSTSGFAGHRIVSRGTADPGAQQYDDKNTSHVASEHHASRTTWLGTSD